MRKGFRIIKFKKDKPIFQIKDVSKSLIWKCTQEK